MSACARSCMIRRERCALSKRDYYLSLFYMKFDLFNLINLIGR